MSDAKARVDFPKDMRPEPYIDGRNGCFGMSAIEAWKSSGFVHIDGLGKKGSVIRGGFCIPAEAMDALAMRWLEARGMMMPAARKK